MLKVLICLALGIFCSTGISAKETNTTLIAYPDDLTATVSTLESTCNGSNGAITISASKGTPPYSYSLNGGPAQASNSFMLLKAGNYKVTVKDASGSSIELNALVKDNCCALELTLSAPDIQCGQTTTVITADATKGVPPYQFSINGGSIQAANTFTRGAGTYRISVKDATGCFVEKSITIKPLASDLDASATAPEIKCGQANGTITVTATNGTAPYTYSLNNGSFQSDNVFSNLGAGAYNVIVKDANGCTKQVDIRIRLTGSNLGASATSPVIPCNASNGVLTVLVAGGIPPHTFSLDGGTPQALNIFTGLKAGKYKITVRDDAGCSVDTYTDIEESCCTTELRAAAPDVLCGQNTTTITATATKGIEPYQYAIDGGAFQASNTFIKGAGTYKISAKDANGCVVDFSITVKSSPSDLQAAAEAPDITCGDTRGSITVLASKGQQPYTYSLNNGAFQSSNIFANLAAGNYTLTVKDAAGCQIALGTQLKLSSVPNLSIVDPSEVCAPSTVDITANAVTTGSEPGLNYTYWLDAGATQALTNPRQIEKSGQYYIKAIKTAGCTITKPVKVTVNPVPSITIKASDSICSGLTANIEITGQGSAPWSFQYSDGSQAYFVNNINTQQYTLRVTPVQTTTFTITSVNDRFCSNRNPENNKVTIRVSDPIPGIRLKEALVSENKPTILTGRTLQGFTYKWEPPVGLNTYNSPTPTFNFNQQVDYRINMTSSAGCVTTDSLLVTLVNASNPSASADFFLPNAFSPNGDGRNDLFFPFAVNIRELRYFRIFNRWGELVFETKTLGDGWNGTFKGQKQPPDSYMWAIEGISEEGKTVNKYGNVLLMR